MSDSNPERTLWARGACKEKVLKCLRSKTTATEKRDIIAKGLETLSCSVKDTVGNLLGDINHRAIQGKKGKRVLSSGLVKVSETRPEFEFAVGERNVSGQKVQIAGFGRNLHEWSDFQRRGGPNY